MTIKGCLWKGQGQYKVFSNPIGRIESTYVMGLSADGRKPAMSMDSLNWHEQGTNGLQGIKLYLPVESRAFKLTGRDSGVNLKCQKKS